MRFMMMVKADKDSEAGKPPSQELMAAIGKLSQEQSRAGVLLESGGLLPSSHGARLDVARGQVVVTDGPFSETKELVGGFAILKAGSRAEAIRMGERFMQVHADVLGPEWEGQLEVRQIADFGEDCH